MPSDPKLEQIKTLAFSLLVVLSLALVSSAQSAPTKLDQAVELIRSSQIDSIEKDAANAKQVAELLARIKELETPPPVPTSSVRLLFSDLSAGPDKGWSVAQPNRGAAVSIWAPSFGGPRGASFVTVNGVELKSDSDYAEWNADSFDVKFLKRTTFWLNSNCVDGAGTISVTINGVKSNALPFRVISGNIWFIHKDSPAGGNGSHEKPWNRLSINSSNGVYRLRPGDVCYIRQSATPFEEVYTGGHQNLYLNGMSHGTESAPITLAAYPGEKPVLRAMDGFANDTNISNYMYWWTFSKLTLIAGNQNILLWGDGSKAIGCDCMGSQYGSANTPINTLGSMNDVYGCSVHGQPLSTSFNDHGLYLSGDPSRVRGSRLKWNYWYNNSRFERAVTAVVNHMVDRIPVGSYCKQHEIAWNLFENVPGKEYRAIGVFSMGAQIARPQPPEPALIHDNLIVGAGPGIFYQNEGSAKWYNNVAVNCSGVSALQLGSANLTSVLFENNTMHFQGGRYLEIIPPPATGSVVIRGNTWLGAGQPPVQDSAPKIRDVADLLANYYDEWVGRLGMRQ